MDSPDISIAIEQTLKNGLPFTATVAEIMDYLGINTSGAYPVFGGIDFTNNPPDKAFKRVKATCIPLSAPLVTADALIPGISLASIFGALPQDVTSKLPDFGSTCTLQYVDFQLLPAADALLGIAVTFDLTTANPNTWAVTNNIELQLTAVRFYVANPKQQGPPFDLTIFGDAQLCNNSDTLTSISFEFDLAAVSLSLFYSMPDPGKAVPLNNIFGALGLQTAAFDGFDVDDFQFNTSLVDKSVYLLLCLSGDQDAPFFGKGSNFTLDTIALEAQADPQQCSIQFSAEISYKSDKEDPDGPMIFDASIGCSEQNVGAVRPEGDVTVTWNISAGWQYSDQDATAGMPIAKMLAKLGIPVSDLPDFLNDIDICSLSLEATTDGTVTTYSMTTVFSVNWDFGDGNGYLDDSTTLTIADDGSGTITGSIDSVIDIDGFSFRFSYDFGNTSVIKVEGNFGGFDIKGQLNVGKDKIQNDPIIAKMTYKPQLSVGQAVAEVMGFATGNNNVVLTSPWDVLNSIGLPELDLSVTFSKKLYTVTFGFPKNTFSILGVFFIDTVVLTYDATKTGTNKFSVAITSPQLEMFGYGTDPVTLTPADPSATQSLPKSAPPALEIKLVVAGQNAVIPGQITDVASGLRAASTIVQSNSLSGQTQMPKFSSGGWMLGSQLVIKGQIWFQFLFDDPELYGARIDILSGGKFASASLEKLQGLSAEIDYRKVNATVGVYQGSLTLPNSAAQLDYGFCQIHLPSIAAAIYTDGGFSVDIGFPQNGDFSNCVMIAAATYVGSGGVYVSHLTSSDAPQMPGGMVHAEGQFGTVTAFGLGLKFGYGRSASFGPVSASISLTLEGIFNGVFSAYTVFSPGDGQATTEYYNVHATVGLNGTLTGSANFVIVSAYVYVNIGVYVDVTAEALAPVIVTAGAYVDVDVTGNIGIGVFSVSKQFSFSGSVSCGLTLYDPGNIDVPWGSSAKLLTDRAAFPEISRKSVTWEDLQRAFKDFPQLENKVPVNIWPLPVLTLSEGQWCYVADFGLEVITGNVPDTAFSPFVAIVLTWFVNAYMKATGGPTLDPANPFSSLSVTRVQLHELAGAIEKAHQEKAFMTADDTAHLNRNGILFSYTLPNDASAVLENIAAFPVLPGSTVSLNVGNGYESFPLVPEVNEQIMRDYILLVIKGTLHAAEQLFENIAGPLMVDEIYTSLYQGGGTLQIAGMATRFLQHGVRVKTANSGYQGLYYVSGQQFAFIPQTGGIQMMLGMEGWIAPLMLSSSDQLPLLYTQDTISQSFLQVPSIAGIGVILNPSMAKQPDVFKLSHATQVTLAGSSANLGTCWRIPRNLRQALAGSDLFFNTFVAVSPGQGNVDLANINVIEPTAYNWAVQVQIIVARNFTGAGRPIYTIQNVNGPLVELCEELISGRQFTIDQIEIFYSVSATTAVGSSGSAASVTIDAASANFIYQNNFSILEDSGLGAGLQNRESEVVTDYQLLFVNRLLAAMLTNRGGFYLTLGTLTQGIPDNCFTNGNTASLTAVISLQSFNFPLSVPAFANALRVPGNTTVSVSQKLAVWSPAYERTVLNLKPGELQVQLSYTDLQAENDDNYQNSLNYLFQLSGLALTITMPGGKQIMLHPDPVVIGPDTYLADSSQRTFTYTLDIFSITRGQVPHRFEDWIKDIFGIPEDPYILIGSTLSFANSMFTDLYGNLLPMSGISGNEQQIVWTEPLIPITAWPGITIDYTFGELMSVKWIELKLTWRSKNALISDTEKSNYLATYQRILYQLKRANATVTTTLLPDAVFDTALDGESLVQRLIDTVYEILFNLENMLHLQLKMVPIRLALSTRFQHINKNVLFALETVLTISLQDNIPVADKADRIACAAVSTLIPDSWQDEFGIPVFKHHTFADVVEDIFKDFDYKLLNGETKNQNNPDLWVFRYGTTGVQFTISPEQVSTPGYQYGGYAPTPLATQLLTRNDISPNYGGGQVTPGPGLLSVNNLDLDKVMQQFLGMLENFLTPAMAVPISWISPESLTTIAQAKYTIANVFSSYTGSMSSQVLPAPGFVNDAFCQSMLKDTQTFYQVQSFATFNVSISLPEGTLPPENFSILGQIEGYDDEGLSLSPVRATFNFDEGISQASVAIAISNPQQGSRLAYTVNGRLRIKAIHYDLKNIEINPFNFNVTTPPSFETGTWLTFINQPADGSWPTIPAQTVGLPLRAIPTPPIVLEQGYTTGGSDTDSLLLNELKQYSVTGTIRNTMFAQDQVTVRVAPVAGGSQKICVGDTAPDLLDAIARYLSIYPPLEPMLSNELLTYQYTPTVTNLQLLSSVQTLADICGDVANLAGALPPSLPLQTASSYNYILSAVPAEPVSDPWKIAVSPVAGVLTGGADNLVVSIPGYATVDVGHSENTMYYSYMQNKILLNTEAGLTNTNYQVSLTDTFDVTGAQGAQMFYSVQRNLSFPPAFNYTTMEISAVSPILPHLIITQSIDISTLPLGSGPYNPPQHRALADHFIAMFVQICSSIMASEAISNTNLFIQLQVGLSFPVGDTDNGFQLPPVVQSAAVQSAVSFAVNAPTDGPEVTAMSVALAANVFTLYPDLNGNNSPWSGMNISIQADVFVNSLTQAGTTLPSLSIRSLYLPCAMINI